ncbi:hypothetical protein [Microbacterium gorillae]|uniref:hypothetical protein n=1 Tax=Microbacterium gorillae TaxID=1231063 RepID=UPI003D96F997
MKLRCTLCGFEQPVYEEDPDAAVDDMVHHTARVHGGDPRLVLPSTIEVVHADQSIGAGE